jgi:competence protein ComEC
VAENSLDEVNMRRIYISRICAVVLLIIIPAIFTFTHVNATAFRTVTFINVGQGDSALIRDGSGYDVLIDGGQPSAGPTVVAYLRQQGVSQLDAIVASHADSDHIGGLIDVLHASDIQVDQVIYNGYPGTTQTWSDFVAAVEAKGLHLTTVQFPQELTWGNQSVHVLNPASGLTNPESNDVSLVLRIDSGSIHYLFTGDIDATIEATVVARGTPVAAQVLKVAHHGSQYSSSAEFLSAVSPDDAIISVGKNSYGQPSADTIARLEAAGATVWRTDVSGNILVSSDGVTYSINPELVRLSIYLPLIIKQSPSTPSSTPTQITPAKTPTKTLTPTPTTQPPATTGNVAITNIFYDGTGSSEPDEYVEIKNEDNKSIQLQNWTLRDNANHIFTFPSFVMTPGKVCRVYTNEYHSEWCGFDYHSGSPIWNNDGDTAYLKDAMGNLISQYTYR